MTACLFLLEELMRERQLFFCFSTRILDQWRLKVEQERGSVNPWSTTLTFQDRASKDLLFLMSLWKECITKMSAICNMHLHSVSICGFPRAPWRFTTGFPYFQWLFTSREVSQMHYKLSGTDFNNKHLLFKFLPVLFAITHTYIHTKHTHSKSKFIFQVKLILIK